MEDPATGAIVSAAFLLLPMRWRLGSVELPVGQIEAVGTDPAYRRRGLSRRIIEALHAMSARQGHLLTGIVGVRYLYRRFGYEYAAPLNGFRDQERSMVRTERGTIPHVRLARLGDAEALAAVRSHGHGPMRSTSSRSSMKRRLLDTDIAGHVPGSFMEVSFSVAVDADVGPIALYAKAPTGPDGGWAAIMEVVLGPECRGREATVVRSLAAHVLATVDAVAQVPVAGVRGPGGSAPNTPPTTPWRLNSVRSTRPTPGTSGSPMRPSAAVRDRTRA